MYTLATTLLAVIRHIYTMALAHLLLLLTTVRTGPLFPPQPTLPTDVILTLVEDDSKEWLEDLVREDNKIKEFGENNTIIPKLRTNTTDILDSLDQTELGYFEGDIVGVKLVWGGGKNVLLEKTWDGGVVPYVMSTHFREWEREVVRRAMEEIECRTCVQFVERKDERSYVHILQADGCFSSVGRQGGVQVVSLGSGCVQHGVVVHELLHVLGMWHEQSRHDRDQYVRILWQNILPGMEDQFGRYHGVTSHQYDMGSIMHYGSTAFSANNEKTIVPLAGRGGGRMGQRRGLSTVDVDKLWTVYQCYGQERGQCSQASKVSTRGSLVAWLLVVMGMWGRF